MKVEPKKSFDFIENIGSFNTYNDLIYRVNLFCKKHSVSLDNIYISSDYEHSYYDSIESHVNINGTRFESDEEYALRLEEIAVKKKQDAENAKKSRAKAKETQALKDKQEYARLKKQFEGLEVDPNSI